MSEPIVKSHTEGVSENQMAKRIISRCGNWLVRSLAALWYRLDRRHRRITLANLEFAYGAALTPEARERLARRGLRPFRALRLGDARTAPGPTARLSAGR